MDQERAETISIELKDELGIKAGPMTPADPQYQATQLMGYLEELDSEAAKDLAEFCEARGLNYLIRATTWKGLGVRIRTAQRQEA